MNEDLENTIQLDEFEVNALEQEQQEEQQEANKEVEPESKSAESKEEPVKEPEEVKEEPEPKEEKPAELSEQERIDRAVSSRVRQEKLKIAEEKAENKRLQARISELEEFTKSEAERNQKLQSEIGKDDLIDQSVKDLAVAKEIPQQQQQENNVVILDNQFDQRLQQIAGAELEIKMMELNPTTHNIQAQKLALHIGNGHIPYDVVQLASKHENGAEFIDQVVGDQNVLNELRIASIESKDIESFSLKFNELADKVKVTSENSYIPKPKKAKPTPNAPLNPSPKVGESDDNTVFLD